MTRSSVADENILGHKVPNKTREVTATNAVPFVKRYQTQATNMLEAALLYTVCPQAFLRRLIVLGVQPICKTNRNAPSDPW